MDKYYYQRVNFIENELKKIKEDVSFYSDEEIDTYLSLSQISNFYNDYGNMLLRECKDNLSENECVKICLKMIELLKETPDYHEKIDLIIQKMWISFKQNKIELPTYKEQKKFIKNLNCGDDFYFISSVMDPFIEIVSGLIDYNDGFFESPFYMVGKFKSISKKDCKEFIDPVYPSFLQAQIDYLFNKVPKENLMEHINKLVYLCYCPVGYGLNNDNEGLIFYILLKFIEILQDCGLKLVDYYYKLNK